MDAMNRQGLILIFAFVLLANEMPPTMGASPTFSNGVGKIFYDRCASCHRPGQSGPFALLEYKQIVEHSQTIATVVAKGYMPPWKPVDHGVEYAHTRKLSNADREAILKWIELDCPIGDGPVPTPPVFSSTWSLGTPDLVVRLENPFPIPAEGPDQYRSFAFSVGLPEDRWIKAIEVRPTARAAVHHALFFVDVDGTAKNQKSRDGLPGFVGMNFLRGKGNLLQRVPESMARGLGGYVPGAVPSLLPGDLARFLPRGSDIVMQTHFHPTGKLENEQTELGIYFAKQTPSQRLVSIQLPPLFGMGAGIDIPAGKKDFHLHESYRLPIDIRAVEIGGHAHYLCSKMSMRAKLPNEQVVVLLDIEDWDLDWQDQYIFRTPIDLPAGTEVTVDLWYDNSEDNPENPFHPPQRVTWGRESTDEMGSITLLATARIEQERELLERDLQMRSRMGLASRIRSQVGLMGGFGGNNILGDRIIRLLDRDRNGVLDRAELPAKMQERLLDLFDEDGNESIDPTEMELGRKNIRGFLDEDESLRSRLREQKEKETQFQQLELTVLTADGVSTRRLSNQRGSVFIFSRTDCPIANAYVPKLNRMQQHFGKDDFDWYYVYSQSDDEPARLRTHAQEYRLEFMSIADGQLQLARKLGASSTPQAVVITKTGEMVYRGRIDDLFEDYGKKRNAITQDDLQDVLRSIQKRVKIAYRETEVIGCKIHFE